MTLAFIGHGYVGLVTACVFADFGNKVWVIGRTKEKIKRLNRGDPIIYEPGLKELLEKNLAAGRINFTLDYKQPINESEIIFITVGTPPGKNGQADLSSVFKVAENIGRSLRKDYTVVTCKSTVPVGTNKRVKKIIDKLKPKNTTVDIASCPEFLREGTAIQDTLNPDRIVIGSNSQKAINILLELHKPLNGKRVITNLPSAELIKYTANAMLATKVSFANLISFYCEKTGADVETVLNAVGLDKRIGRVFMNPGLGYGGSCLPKDVKALIAMGIDLDIDTILLKGVDKINHQARQNFLKKILTQIKGKNITLWGLSFKPNTDDIREAPSLYIINQLLANNFKINVYDPAAIQNIKNLFGNKISYKKDPYQAIKKADGLAILTEWNEFKLIDLKRVKKLMNSPLIFDGRNIYSPKKMKQLGFKYYSTGRKLA